MITNINIGIKQNNCPMSEETKDITTKYIIVIKNKTILLLKIFN